MSDGNGEGRPTGIPYYGYYIVFASFIILMTGWGTFFSYGVFFKPLAGEFGWGRAETSGAYALATLMAGFFAIIMGRLNDTLGPRAVVSTGGFIAAAGYMLLSLADSLWQFYLFYGILVGIGVGGIFVPTASTISRWFVKKRTFMTGLALMGGSMGTMVIPRVAAWLIRVFGWRLAYGILGLANLTLIMAMAQILRSSPEKLGKVPYGAEDYDKSIQMKGLSLQEAVQGIQFWLFCGLFFSFFFCINSFLTHIVVHATGLGISLEKAANMMILFGAGGIAGRIAIGLLGDRIGNRETCLGCFVLLFLAFLFLSAAADFSGLLIVSAAIGFCFAGIGALMAPLVADFFGLKSHGVILGVIYAVDMVGGAIGPVMAGAIFDLTGRYEPAFLSISAVAFIGCLLIFLLGKAREK